MCLVLTSLAQHSHDYSMDS